MTLAQALLPISLTTWGLFAAGAAAMSVPIIIHLLTRWRRKPQAWAAMQFLLEAYRKHRRRLQIEQLLLLLVRCLILLLLGLALSGPLLAGCGSSGGAMLSAGRTVYLVIDDSLASQVRIAPDEVRLDQLKASAGELLEGLSRNDRVAVIAAARPARMLTPSPSADRAAANRAIESIEPRFSEADLPRVMELIHQHLRNADQPESEVTVVVLSPMARSSMRQVEPGQATLAPPETEFSFVLSEPANAEPNVQIASATPRRSMVVVDPQLPVSTPVVTRLRRFGPTPGGAVTTVRLTVTGRGDEPIVTTRRHTWAPGQSEAVLTVNLVLGEPDPQRTGDDMLVIEAELAAGGDELPADDRRIAVAQLRRQLRIGMVDLQSREAAFDERAPRYWLSTALTPRRRAGSEIDPARLIDLNPGFLEPDQLENLDAVMVLRPDLLSDADWRHLAAFTKAGGLTWLFVPDAQAPGIWSAGLRQQFGLDWRVALEIDAADEASTGWALRTDQPAPPPLNVLAADWQRLLSPVRVTRRLPLRGPTEAQRWLEAEDGSALLAAGDVERGTVLLLTTALSPQWSNLVTKPIFVALVNETLRGVLGESDALAGLNATEAGDWPALPPPWSRAPQILGPDGEPISVVTRFPATPLETPGLYTPNLEIDWPLPVNVDADAGDTRALTREEVASRFEPMGAVRWFELAAASTVMRQQIARTSLAWPILWIVFALAVVETLLARWVSHAGQRSDVPWLARATAMIRGGG